jgi:hypothetical protein
LERIVFFQASVLLGEERRGEERGEEMKRQRRESLIYLSD